MFKLLFLLCEHHNDPLVLPPYHDTRRHRLFGAEEHNKLRRRLRLNDTQALLLVSGIKLTFLPLAAKTVIIVQRIPKLIRNSFR